MRPKGKLFALVVLFAAVGLLTATGAFTTVTAERTATVDVAGDSAALLALQANSTYADNNAGGGSQLQVNLDNPGTSQGLNPNANTTFEYVFNVTNNGDNDIDLDVTISSTNSDIADSTILETSTGTDLTSTTERVNTGNTVEIHLKFVFTNDVGAQVDEIGSSVDINIEFQANET